MRAQRTPPLHFALLCLGFVLTTPWEALAYIDPGTGSYLFQLAAAGLLVAGAGGTAIYFATRDDSSDRVSIGGVVE